MTPVVYSAQALGELKRLVAFEGNQDIEGGERGIVVIIDAIQILERHPFVGRPVRGGLRELVISRGRTGYVAMYRVPRAAGQVQILAVRHQREAGFA